MSTLPRYVLDSNVFMEAARRYYAFDIAPAFWDALISHAESGRVISIDRVKVEIDRGADDLAGWADRVFSPWFLSTNDEGVLEAYSHIMAWAHGHGQFTMPAKANFAHADNADAWVVAHARAKGCVVVTHEQFDPNIRRDIRIPNVCQAFGVQYVDTFQMLRDLGVKLG